MRIWCCYLFTATLLVLCTAGCSQRTPDDLSDILHEGDPDFDWYSKYVTLESKIQMAKNMTGNRVVMFNGQVENQGEKRLDTLEVTLTLFNYDEPIHSEVRIPIDPNSRHTPPVPAQGKRTFRLILEDFPKEWHASSAEMKVSGFRFESGQ